jgi:hypothetical protein
MISSEFSLSMASLMAIIAACTENRKHRILNSPAELLSEKKKPQQKQLFAPLFQ